VTVDGEAFGRAGQVVRHHLLHRLGAPRDGFDVGRRGFVLHQRRQFVDHRLRSRPQRVHEAGHADRYFPNQASRSLYASAAAAAL